MNKNQIEAGEENYRQVKEFMKAHLCATQKECAEALGLSVMAVNRHVKKIRESWR